MIVYTASALVIAQEEVEAFAMNSQATFERGYAKYVRDRSYSTYQEVRHQYTSGTYTTGDVAISYSGNHYFACMATVEYFGTKRVISKIEWLTKALSQLHTWALQEDIHSIAIAGESLCDMERYTVKACIEAEFGRSTIPITVYAL